MRDPLDGQECQHDLSVKLYSADPPVDAVPSIALSYGLQFRQGLLSEPFSRIVPFSRLSVILLSIENRALPPSKG